MRYQNIVIGFKLSLNASMRTCKRIGRLAVSGLPHFPFHKSDRRASLFVLYFSPNALNHSIIMREHVHHPPPRPRDQGRRGSPPRARRRTWCCKRKVRLVLPFRGLEVALRWLWSCGHPQPSALSLVWCYLLRPQKHFSDAARWEWSLRKSCLDGCLQAHAALLLSVPCFGLCFSLSGRGCGQKHCERGIEFIHRFYRTLSNRQNQKEILNLHVANHKSCRLSPKFMMRCQEHG